MTKQKTRHVSVKEAVARVIADVRLPRPYRGPEPVANSLERKRTVRDEFEALYPR